MLNLDKKYGFLCYENRIRIYDAKGRIFYYYNAKKLPHKFNLPKGTYFTKNKLKKIEPIKYKIILPKKTYHPMPDKLKIIYAKNPNVASVRLSDGLIIFDNEFRDIPLPFKVFIFLHEIGHFYYPSDKSEKTEMLCDYFAKNYMLNIGFNPSQINASISYFIKRSPHRTKFIFDELKTKENAKH